MSKNIQQLMDEGRPYSDIVRTTGLQEAEVIRVMTAACMGQGITNSAEIAMKVGLQPGAKHRIAAAKAVLKKRGWRKKVQRKKRVGRSAVPKELSFGALHGYAVDNSKSFLDVLREGKSVTKKIPKRKILTPGGIVRETWETFRGEEQQLTLTSFKEMVALDLDNNSLCTPENCPLEGYVAQQLYEIALEQKHEGLATTTQRIKRITDPVMLEEIVDTLEVDFGGDNKRIVGVLKTSLVREAYPLNEHSQLADSEGVPYNIEGVVCWSGSEKGTTRELLQSLVQEHVLAYHDELHERSVRKQEKEKEELLAQKRNVRETGGSSYGFTITGEGSNPKGVVIGFKNSRFLQNYEKRFGGISVEREGSGQVTVWCDSESVAARFRSSFEDFKRSSRRQRGKKGYHKDLRIELVKNEVERTIADIEERIGKLERQPIEKPTLHYLGLEGPNFNSFFGLSEVARAHQQGLEATVAEYDYRSCNIMQSLVDAYAVDGAGNNLLQAVSVAHANIDDLILSDFADQEVIQREQQRASSGPRRDVITFQRSGLGLESISLEQYHLLLQDLETEAGKRKGYVKRVAKAHGISQEFIEAVARRDRTKYDVVFLDYLRPRKKKDNIVLTCLAERRLNDRAIVAYTHNLSIVPGHNPEITIFRERFEAEGMGSKEALHRAREERVAEIDKEIRTTLQASGYEVDGEACDIIYNDNNPMVFMAYKIERRKDE